MKREADPADFYYNKPWYATTVHFDPRSSCRYYIAMIHAQVDCSIVLLVVYASHISADLGSYTIVRVEVVETCRIRAATTLVQTPLSNCHPRTQDVTEHRPFMHVAAPIAAPIEQSTPAVWFGDITGS